MNKPLLSVVVPVYNAEKYIDICIQSILVQDMNDFEIILIDDGSIDQSLSKCLAYQQQDNRVKVFHIENKGVSFARNYGIKQSIGKWIMFLDSDDYLFSNCFNKIFDNLSEDVEEICCSYSTDIQNNILIQGKVVQAKDIIKMTLDSVNYNCLPDFFEIKDSTFMSCWGKLYLKEVIEKYFIFFDENLKLSEDTIFHLNYLSHINKVLLLNIEILYYRTHSLSVTNAFKEEHVLNRLYLFEKYSNILLDYHIVYLLLQLICDVEKVLKGKKRKDNEKIILNYIRENHHLFIHVKNKKLSKGKWQNKIFQLCNILLCKKYYVVSLYLIRIYINLKGKSYGEKSN